MALALPFWGLALFTDLSKLKSGLPLSAPTFQIRICADYLATGDKTTVSLWPRQRRLQVAVPQAIKGMTDIIVAWLVTLAVANWHSLFKDRHGVVNCQPTPT